ncbi:hypothetical protein BBBOND_0102550 [Babesia bigemina]|uniref:Uncharacterized protein n=1 Tax=Babesia bigemina TaxID=5866 RepID=A0A061D1D7_BABBI|nr:hypothetical protein BBBOND_0102550 [Babesia bigemina]CDR93927.1 hypothetical protein BBBOND_0102550 [Babesia bigemina]|eukprot:XP_012766113.1 hypothetical protein BBBOND_0102550 [Babesia bigemina]
MPSVPKEYITDPPKQNAPLMRAAMHLSNSFKSNFGGMVGLKRRGNMHFSNCSRLNQKNAIKKSRLSRIPGYTLYPIYGIQLPLKFELRNVMLWGNAIPDLFAAQKYPGRVYPVVERCIAARRQTEDLLVGMVAIQKTEPQPSPRRMLHPVECREEKIRATPFQEIYAVTIRICLTVVFETVH